jgi:hypothetical protein
VAVCDVVWEEEVACLVVEIDGLLERIGNLLETIGDLLEKVGESVERKMHHGRNRSLGHQEKEDEE